jgi:hypothetical protein
VVAEEHKESTRNLDMIERAIAILEDDPHLNAGSFPLSKTVIHWA